MRAPVCWRPPEGAAQGEVLNRTNTQRPPVCHSHALRGGGGELSSGSLRCGMRAAARRTIAVVLCSQRSGWIIDLNCKCHVASSAQPQAFSTQHVLEFSCRIRRARGTGRTHESSRSSPRHTRDAGRRQAQSQRAPRIMSREGRARAQQAHLASSVVIAKRIDHRALSERRIRADQEPH